MLRLSSRGQRLAGYLTAVVLLVSGCFQSAGTNPETFLVAQSGPTFTPFPSLTPEAIIVTATLDPFAAPAQDFIVPTLDPALVIPAGSDVGAASDTGFAQPFQLDPLDMTATAIVGGATSTAAAYITETAIASGIGFPTATLPVLLPTTAPGIPGVDCIHEVQATDRNVYRISLQYGVTVDAIARASGLTNPNLIYLGQKLTIPGCGSTGQIPPPTSVPGSDGSGQPVPSTGGNVYTVQQGDTLFKISIRFGVPVLSIATANGISDINLIVINQQLVIPAA